MDWVKLDTKNLLKEKCSAHRTYRRYTYTIYSNRLNEMAPLICVNGISSMCWQQKEQRQQQQQQQQRKMVSAHHGNSIPFCLHENVNLVAVHFSVSTIPCVSWRVWIFGPLFFEFIVYCVAFFHVFFLSSSPFSRLAVHVFE